MKSLAVLPCLLSISLLNAWGQGRRSPGTTRPRVTAPDLTTNNTIFLTGKVVIDDGSVLTEPASIQTVCRGQKRTETHTDTHGGFSFQFGGRLAGSSEVEFDAEAPGGTTLGGRPERRDLHDCELKASIAGFTSDSIALEGRISGNESADIGRIVLHRVANVDGFTISATTGQAPGAAKKAWQKGQEQEKKGKWEEARRSLEKAVALYPRFAVAWFELGRVQLKANDSTGARQSFQQSLAADSKYISPYRGLAELALHERNWKELTDFSAKVLALNPVSFPDVWLSNAIGNFCLQDFAAAENSARRGLQIDTEHRFPKLDYLLAVALLQRAGYREATEHLRAFISHASPAEAAEAQKRLDEISHLSAEAEITPADKR